MKQNFVLKLHGGVVCAPSDLWLARIAGGDTERDVHFYVGDRYWRSPNTMRGAVGSRRPSDSSYRRNITFG